MLLIAKGIKAHGIRGDIKAESLMDSPDLLLKIAEVTVKNITYKVQSIKKNRDYVLIKLEGIDTMDKAEGFRNAGFYVEKNKLPPLKEKTYYIDDIIGCTVLVNEKSIGIISDVLQYGGADIFDVKGAEKNIMFPFLEKLVEFIDIDKKQIKLNKTEFEKVAVYED